MIDAYEIGIQLLLQEDVSAGLAVINQGLAEVDRAIAATSADLGGLVARADSATKAVAAALNSRTGLGTTREASVSSTPEGGQVNADSRKASTPEVTSGVKASAPEVSAKAQEPLSGRPADNIRQTAQNASQGQIQRAADPTAPTPNTVADLPPNGQSATQSLQKPADYSPKAPSPPDIMAASVNKARPAAGRDIASAVEQPRQGVTPTATRVALTASVARGQQPAFTRPQAVRARQHSDASLAAVRDRSSAPWSGIEQSVSRTELSRSHDKAAAPRSANSNENGSGGGTVMLDGRLVGQWLSEHMAREASRPPSGTSFFDSRQAPAWNISGAL